jgi:predicted DNA-binding transcriptional regulator AlpA
VPTVARVSPKPDKKFLTTPQLLERWGSVSYMFLVRRKGRPGFPKPVRMGGRLKLWDLDEVEAYERSCVAGGAEESG